MATQTFRATVRKQGPNPYVDVPERVSRAFQSSARSGRIRVTGRLDATPIRANLVPVGRGRHRLYVNGGMRAAAGVSVGDSVRLALRAIRPEDVPVPRDLAAGLRKTPGAKAAFDALSPSHRRELLRHVDDARTPQNRRRRIESTVEHVLGRTVPQGRADLSKPLWECPKCGHRFVTRNMYHSCRRHSLDDPFAGRPPEIRCLFDRFRAMVESCGPVTPVPYGDRVGFMVKVRFAGATPKSRWLDVGFWLPRRIQSPRFRKVETITANVHLHTLRVTDPGQLDEELARWIREAYRVGCREHLSGRVPAD